MLASRDDHRPHFHVTYINYDVLYYGPLKFLHVCKLILFFLGRYLLYGVNSGEGFNLRRDVYIRVANLVRKLSQDHNWVLVSNILRPTCRQLVNCWDALMFVPEADRKVRTGF